MFTLVVAVQYLLPKPVNWQRTYMTKDKNPFGTYAIRQLLEPTFAKNVEMNKTTLYNLKYGQSPTCLILMDHQINLSKPDLKTMFQFVEDGNTVFMAASQFDGLLADTFHLRTYPKIFKLFEKPDSLVKRPGAKVKMMATNLQKKVYDYPMLANCYYFSNYDTTKLTIASMLDDSSAVMIEHKIGKGRIIFMAMPDVFGNYFIVKHKNRDYAYSVLSYATRDTKEIIWDENYKMFNVKSASFLKLIMESDALYAAYMLMLLAIIVHMISDGRRRQRAIPVVEPLKNTTLEFVNVVSHVYFNSENHKYIAEERVKYFYDTIRKRFNVPTSEISDLFIETISDLSGYDAKLVRQLFKYCENLRNASSASEHDLIELNRQITNFNTKSLR